MYMNRFHSFYQSKCARLHCPFVVLWRVGITCFAPNAASMRIVLESNRKNGFLCSEVSVWIGLRPLLWTSLQAIFRTWDQQQGSSRSRGGKPLDASPWKRLRMIRHRVSVMCLLCHYCLDFCNCVSGLTLVSLDKSQDWYFQEARSVWVDGVPI